MLKVRGTRDVNWMRFFASEMARVRIERARGIRDHVIMTRKALAEVEETLSGHELDVCDRGRLQTERRRLSGLLRVYCDEQSILSSKFEEMYWRIRDIERVRFAFIAPYDGHLQFQIITYPLFGKSWEGAWHRIGRFRILVEYQESVTGGKFPDSGAITYIRWLNLDGAKLRHSGPEGKTDLWQAPPYIDSRGYSRCFGIGRDALRDSMARMEWPLAVATLVRFPENPGQENAIAQWPRVSEKDVPLWYLETFPECPPRPEDGYI